MENFLTGSMGMVKLYDALLSVRNQVYKEGQQQLEHWLPVIKREEFKPSAENLAYYLALRRRDLRYLQTQLMALGLSSLGRSESHVLPNLDSIIATLSAISGVPSIDTAKWPGFHEFFEGQQHLQRNATEVFGHGKDHRSIRIMVTLPTEAATNHTFIYNLIDKGTECVRINCAHDNPAVWLRMIENLRAAERDLGQRCLLLMDLAGPKVRTKDVIAPKHENKLTKGSHILLTYGPTHKRYNFDYQTSCSHPEIVELLQEGEMVWIDDGHIGTEIEEIRKEGLVLRVTRVRSKGEPLREEKGLNFPGVNLELSPLTEKDLTDLDFVAEHADMVGYSFVQHAEDMAILQLELAKRLGENAKRISIVAKIETPNAVQKMAEVVVQRSASQLIPIMIARGDLAVEIGYERLAEIQEEILWICEAAHVPVIWATQVLENLVKNAVPSRSEMTDAAMSERAECVMLNKGPYILEGVTTLDKVLTRMQTHQMKKTPQLRALNMWMDLEQ